MTNFNEKFGFVDEQKHSHSIICTRAKNSTSQARDWAIHSTDSPLQTQGSTRGHSLPSWSQPSSSTFKIYVLQNAAWLWKMHPCQFLGLSDEWCGLVVLLRKKITHKPNWELEEQPLSDTQGAVGTQQCPVLHRDYPCVWHFGSCGTQQCPVGPSSVLLLTETIPGWHPREPWGPSSVLLLPRSILECHTPGPSSVLLLTPCWDAAAAGLCLLTFPPSHQVPWCGWAWVTELQSKGWAVPGHSSSAPGSTSWGSAPFSSQQGRTCTPLATHLARGKALRTALGISEKSLVYGNRGILQAVPWCLQGTVQKTQPNHFQCPSLVLPVTTQTEKYPGCCPFLPILVWSSSTTKVLWAPNIWKIISTATLTLEA